MTLSIYPSAQRVLVRHGLVSQLGLHGCSSLYTGPDLRQWFPLRLFTRKRFTVVLSGRTTDTNSAGVRHEYRWSIRLNVVRLRSL